VLSLSGEERVSRGVSSVELRNSWPPQHRCKIIGVVRRRPSAVCWQVLWPVVVSGEAIRLGQCPTWPYGWKNVIDARRRRF